MRERSRERDAQLAEVQERYRWDYYRDIEHLREMRRHAYEGFLTDYGAHGGARYREGALPDLPFVAGAFLRLS